MTGSIMPDRTKPRPDATRGGARRKPKIAGLEAVINQRYAPGASDPRLKHMHPLPRSLAARLQILAPADAGLTNFLEELEAALRQPARANDSRRAEDEPDSDTPVQLASPGTHQTCMQALVQEFSRRQRQATMLVAGCITASCILTFVGIAAIASLAASMPADSDAAQMRGASAMAWPQPAAEQLSLAGRRPIAPNDRSTFNLSFAGDMSGEDTHHVYALVRYARISGEAGNACPTERLKILASLSD